MNNSYLKIICLGVTLLLLVGCNQQKKGINSKPDEEIEQKEGVALVDSANAEEEIGAEQPKPRPVYDYVFDFSDKNAVSVSSGTGGTEWKGFSSNVDYDEFFIDYTEPSSITGVKFDGRIRAKGLENTELMGKMNEFLTNAENSLAGEMIEQARNSSEKSLQIREYFHNKGDLIILALEAWFPYNSQEMYGYFDMNAGKQIKLSDFFYDGFNYINYINTQISEKLDWWDDEQKKAFTGIAGDYPYFHFGREYDDKLYVYFPENNPFFRSTSGFVIELTDKISPYGTKEVSTKYNKYALTDGVMFAQPVVGNLPEKKAEDKINVQIGEWVTELFKDITIQERAKVFREYCELKEFVFEPKVKAYGNYLSVSYCYMDSRDGPWWSNPPMLSAITFDVRTGETVDLKELLMPVTDWTVTQVYYKADIGTVVRNEEVDYDKPSMTYPAKEAVILNAYLYDSLVLEMKQPDGTMLTAYIPNGEIEKVLAMSAD